MGNVCRSPTAERLLKRFHPSLTVASAGLGALVGKGAGLGALVGKGRQRRRSCGGERGERS
ncbi:Low molecular weight protein-tyrosine-phosphatase Wzb [Salmonella enterica subsp. enterica serovar Urbana str. R8-2977]|uniref:Low molecular weight protein-tyrosine-phosphatase Wzb n=1 Tax=Salmonella enterica subsp. enterica serovar Urbana str. R8-2977 TaxID=913084 RepID=G5RXB7_SALET|nr:Low molecular weight protein-tyrosine-phosphatase Wzb [Salmonella enterica subsp. enterica serovar Urbana str. R8-2977]